jgi:hypothetical protein
MLLKLRLRTNILSRAFSFLKYARKSRPELAITLLPPNSIYASHGLVFLRSTQNNATFEYEFKVNRPEFLHTPDRHVMGAIEEQLEALGYKLIQFVSYRPLAWH